LLIVLKLGENEINYPSFATRITIAAPDSSSDTKTRKARWVSSHIRFGGFAVSAILILSSVLLLAVQINQSAWAGTFPGPNGQIAFDKDISGDDPQLDEIYTMNEDGSEQTQLTDNDVDDESPSWSPDGEKIAFESDRDGPVEIYVMDADGSDVTRLTNSANNDLFNTNPSWSPDGEKIAFESNRDDDHEIYTMDADDGSDVTRLTTNGREPSWSPDGEKIAFTSTRDGVEEIYTMDADDGSDVTRLTDNDAFDTSPSWSPDGEKIAFESNRDLDDESQFDAIYTMDADDGSDVTRLTDPNAEYSGTDWGTNTSSPDGDGKKDKKNDHKDKKNDH
jgi:Tol biopolymer transport system component